MGRHYVPEDPPPPKDKPRYRFLVAISGILLLAFGTMATVAALFPEDGPRAAAGPDGSAANPFPQVPGDSGATAGPPPGPRTTTTAGLATAPPRLVSGTYSVIPNAVWDQGFQAQVAITNGTSSPQSWQVKVRYPATVTRYVASWMDGYPEPEAEPAGQLVTFTGTVAIPAGQTVGLKFQFEKASDGDFGPTECSVNGRACSLP